MKYLGVFASSASLTGVRVVELLAAAEALHIDVQLVNGIPWVSPSDPCVFAVFESDCTQDDLVHLAQRCILLRGIYILLESAPTLDNLFEWHASSSARGCNPKSIFIGEPVDRYAEGDYCYHVETFGKKYCTERKQEIIARATGLIRRKGNVDWKHPRYRFFIFVEHTVEEAPAGAPPGWTPAGPVERVFHCLLLVESSRSELLSRYDLKKRPYVGTTSMPTEESIVMSNVARVRRGDYVFDPFCGTGSLLVAAAHCGAYTIGADADGRAMRCGSDKCKTSSQLQQQRRLALNAYPKEVLLAALTPEELELPTLVSNFKVYHLPPPDRIRMNFSCWEGSWRGRRRADAPEGIFDAIITDPPYGLREPRRKVETDLEAVEDAMQAPHKATVALSSYSTHEVVVDLVRFAAAHLAVDGYLVFWYPTSDRYTDDELPSHPSLQLVNNIPQRLSLKVVRRLIVMRKCALLPDPPPTRDDCRPRQYATNLRELMDNTVLEDNKNYMHYREKVKRRQEASEHYRRTLCSVADSSHGQTSVCGNGRRRIPCPDRQAAIVANREKNIRLREEKQLASHMANAKSKKNRMDDADT